MSDWRPTADISALRARAGLYRHIRDFFAQRNVLEVVTPALARHGVTDPHIQCIAVPGYGWLQSSPEYHMKRLLAAGSGPVYQIAHAFRDGENGRRHNPEFTLLEWYRPGFTLDALMQECIELLEPLLAPTRIRRISFRALFAEVTGLDPITAETDALRTRVLRHGEASDLDHAALVDWLMAVEVESALPRDQLTLVHDFPGWAAALAQTRTDEDGATLAQRFEIYAGGYELANGYLELLDADEQQRRFDADRKRRQAKDQKEMEADPYLLAALEAGLPACAGVAIGLERVLMAQLGADRISAVMPFPMDRA